MSKELEYVERMICWYEDNFSQLGKERNQEHIEQLNNIKSALQRLEAIDNANPSEALRCLHKIGNSNYFLGSPSAVDKAIFDTVEQALLKAQENENKALAFDYLVKHFNFECKAESIRNGEKWARFVTIQSKDDEGTWDTTALANLVDYKEEYEFLEQMLKKE